MRTVDWDDIENSVKLIDQRLLPGQLKIVACHTPQEVAEAIKSMVVRGAPALGATAGFGLATMAMNSTARTRTDFFKDLQEACSILQAARSTARNLSWGLERLMKFASTSTLNLDDLRVEILNEAKKLADEDIQINKTMAEFGANLIDDGDTIIHHCNTGALATVDWGTALGVIRMAHEQGKALHVLVDETRPRLQGSRLTAWELSQYGIPYEIISDSAAGYFLFSGQVQKVFFGADRIAANGDVANKIGTYMLALAAFDNRVPVYSVAPKSTVDLTLANGRLIPIEERSQNEVLGIFVDGQSVSPPGAKARNPAFDITPNHLLTAIVTEYGIIYPPFLENLRKFLT
jgi:methylthioribose-1-phosphate isomerase